MGNMVSSPIRDTTGIRSTIRGIAWETIHTRNRVNSVREWDNGGLRDSVKCIYLGSREVLLFSSPGRPVDGDGGVAAPRSRRATVADHR